MCPRRKSACLPAWVAYNHYVGQCIKLKKSNFYYSIMKIMTSCTFELKIFSSAIQDVTERWVMKENWRELMFI